MTSNISKITSNEFTYHVDRYDPVIGDWINIGEFDNSWNAQELVDEKIEYDLTILIGHGQEPSNHIIKYRIIETTTEVYEPIIPLSDADVCIAVSKMNTACDMHMKDYKAVSARSVLEELKYDEHQIEQVLTAIYDAGFTYCFDHHFLSSNGIDGSKEYPPRDACYWGPDQLKSRLQMVSWRLG